MRVNPLPGAALLLALIGVVCAVPAHAAITIQRVPLPQAYTPGQIIDVTVTIQNSDSSTPAALGIVETVPGAWTLQSVSATIPAMIPIKSPEATNPDGTINLSFYYINIPPFPITFTYRVKTGAADTGALNISGHAIYRFSGAEQQSPVVVTSVTATPAAAGGAGCTGCSQTAKSLGVPLGDLFVSALALVTLLALSRQKG